MQLWPSPTVKVDRSLRRCNENSYRHQISNPFQGVVLFGQYSIFEPIDNSVSDIPVLSNNIINETEIHHPPYIHNMEFKDDYIWLATTSFMNHSYTKNDHDTDQSNDVRSKMSLDRSHRPIQPSTEKLLQLLQHTISGVEKVHQKDHTENISNIDIDTKSMVDTTTDCDAAVTDIIPEHMKHVPKLADQIYTALTDIRHIRQNVSNDVSMEKKKNHRHRRQRNKGKNVNGGTIQNGKVHETVKKESQQVVIPPKDIDSDSIHKESDLVLDEIDDNEDDVHDTSPGHSYSSNMLQTNGTSTIPSTWYSLVSTMNSIRILTPLIVQIIWHHQRNDVNLQIESMKLRDMNDDDDDDMKDNNVSKNKSKKNRRHENKKSYCWLLGHSTYDKCTVRQCQSLWHYFEEIYHLLGVSPTKSPNEEMKTVQQQQQRLALYKNVLDTTMKRLVAGYGANTTSTLLSSSLSTITKSMFSCSINGSNQQKSIPVTPIWLNRHPFDSMDEHDQLKLQIVSCLLDKKFGLGLGDTKKSQKESKEKEVYIKSIHTLHDVLAEKLSKRFTGSRLSLYGSCLSDLSLGKSADVDLSLYIKPLATMKDSFEAGATSEEEYRALVKKYVFQTFHLLERDGMRRFQNMVPVTRARVPVVKGTYILDPKSNSSIKSLDFDICFLNDIAVSNSELIRQYSLVSQSVKSLMIAVKRWAKANGICSAQDNAISSYAWMNLVIFYLQCLGYVPNLQCRNLMNAVKDVVVNDYWDSVNKLDTRFLSWEQASSVWVAPSDRNDMSVTALLYGFFEFYTQRFPTSLYMISIRSGASLIPKPKTNFTRSSLFWCIEDPFEISGSHNPHDLGMHANDIGAITIVRCMRLAESYLRDKLLQVLDSESSNESIVSSIPCLWPSASDSMSNNATESSDTVNKSTSNEASKTPNSNASKTNTRSNRRRKKSSNLTAPQSVASPSTQSQGNNQQNTSVSNSIPSSDKNGKSPKPTTASQSNKIEAPRNSISASASEHNDSSTKNKSVSTTGKSNIIPNNNSSSMSDNKANGNSKTNAKPPNASNNRHRRRRRPPKQLQSSHQELADVAA